MFTRVFEDYRQEAQYLLASSCESVEVSESVPPLREVEGADRNEGVLICAKNYEANAADYKKQKVDLREEIIHFQAKNQRICHCLWQQDN